MLAIGDFSRLTHLSVRTLRRYHDAGLLEPATVDDATGYRYYSADQIPTAQVIHRLRELDVPLPDVQRILRSPDPRTRAGLVADHLRRLEADLDRTRAAVASLRRLLQPRPPPLDVELRAVPAATVAAVEDDVAYDEVLAWYAGAMAELDAVVGEPTGPPGGLYDNALFEDGRGHLLVYRPTADPPRSGRVRPVTLPPSSWPPPPTSASMTTSTSPTATWVPGRWRTRSRWPALCGRPTSSARATRPTRRPGGPRSVGRSSACPRGELPGRP